MDIEKIRSGKRKQTKMQLISIKITKTLYKWLKENKYSPTRILNEACKDLGFKPKNE